MRPVKTCRGPLVACPMESHDGKRTKMFRIAVFAAVAIGSCACIMVYAARWGDDAGKVHDIQFSKRKKNLNLFKLKN